MTIKKFKAEAILLAMLLVSVAFGPAVSAADSIAKECQDKSLLEILGSRMVTN